MNGEPQEVAEAADAAVAEESTPETTEAGTTDEATSAA